MPGVLGKGVRKRVGRGGVAQRGGGGGGWRGRGYAGRGRMELDDDEVGAYAYVCACHFQDKRARVCDD
eukprot:1139987-Pelagomonas_calceolata.AAC.10